MMANAMALRSDRANLVALAALWIAMAIVVDPRGNFPVQDDWTYGLAVRTLIDHGVYRIPSFVSANLGPLVHWGALFCWPFGFSFTALRISTLVMGLFGIVGVYFLFREVWGDKRIAFAGAATVLVNPIYFSLANTFMTDVPFVALISFAMALVVRGLRRDDRFVLLSGLALCLVCVLVRQFALVLFGAFACAWVARRGFKPAEIVRAVMPLAVAITMHLAFNDWLARTRRKDYSAGFSDITTASFGDFVYSSEHELFSVITELGVFLLPLAVACLGSSMRRSRGDTSRWPAALAIAAGVAIAYHLMAERLQMPLTGDTLHYFGIGPLMLRDTLLIGWHLPPLTAPLEVFWIAVTSFAPIGAALIVYAVAKGGADGWATTRTIRAFARRAWPAIFLATTALAYLFILLLLATRHDLFDRYLLPLCIIVALALPMMGVRADGSWSRVAWAFAGLWLAASACISVVSTHDFLAWNRTRWMALADLTERQGVSPRRIDGGYEFNGFYLYDPLYESHDEKSWWWVDDDEYLIAAGPMPGYREVRRWPVDRWREAGGSDVFVLRRND
jgi:hypothetical protein